MSKTRITAKAGPKGIGKWKHLVTQALARVVDQDIDVLIGCLHVGRISGSEWNILVSGYGLTHVFKTHPEAVDYLNDELIPALRKGQGRYDI